MADKKSETYADPPVPVFTLTVKRVSDLAADDVVAAFITGDDRGRVFLPADGTDLTVLPSVEVVSTTTAVNNSAPWLNGATANGPVKVQLKYPVSGTVNSPSLFVPVLDAATLVVVASLV